MRTSEKRTQEKIPATERCFRDFLLFLSADFKPNIMQKIFILLFTLLQALAVAAQKKAPKWVDKASKAIITIETTTKEGTSRTGNGVFIHENGEAVAAYDLFRNAQKAIVTTAAG